MSILNDQTFSKECKQNTNRRSTRSELNLSEFFKMMSQWIGFHCILPNEFNICDRTGICRSEFISFEFRWSWKKNPQTLWCGARRETVNSNGKREFCIKMQRQRIKIWIFIPREQQRRRHWHFAHKYICMKTSLRRLFVGVCALGP